MTTIHKAPITPTFCPNCEETKSRFRFEYVDREGGDTVAKFHPVCVDCGTTHGGFTVTELRRAFDKVANTENWKEPIKAKVVASELEVPVYEVAIEFFTGSVASVVRFARITNVDGSREDIWDVTAPGYYAAVGA